jgi:hypothetical protein
MKHNMRTAVVATLFTILAGTALGQSSAPATAPAGDQPSLGDYARKHKDPAKAKPKVFDNDNLPKDDKLSIVGDQTAANTGDSAAADASSNAGSSGAASGQTGADAKASGTTPAAGAAAASPDEERAKKQLEWKSWQDKISAQRNSMDLASRELDVLQKEYQLRAAAMYADVGNRLRNSSQWDKEEADYKQKIADKQKAVDDGKQKLEDMEEDARKAGVPAAMREP